MGVVEVEANPLGLEEGVNPRGDMGVEAEFDQSGHKLIVVDVIKETLNIE